MSPNRCSARRGAEADAARLGHPRPRRPDRAGWRACRRTMSPATSPASRWNSRWRATSACRRCRAATKVFCWRSAIPRSAAMPATIPSSARSASARSSSNSTCRNCLSPCRSARVRVTECQMVNQFKGSAKAPPQFTRGYGLVFGQSERKAMAMALCDRALRATRTRRGYRRRRAGRGVRHLALRQCPGDRLRRASEAAALCRLPGRTRPRAPHARRARRAKMAAEEKEARNEPSRPPPSPPPLSCEWRHARRMPPPTLSPCAPPWRRKPFSR